MMCLFTFSTRLPRSLATVGLTLAALVGSCAPGQLKDGLGPPPGDLETIALTPNGITLAPAQSQTFQISGTLTDGTPVSDFAVSWSATGGAISNGGRYTAGSTAGSFSVVATESVSGLADTGAVTISSSTVTGITVTPASVTLVVGEPRQFTARAALSDGTNLSNPGVSWTATGGTISSTGRYVAGAVTGTFAVTATAPNGPADTSVVTINPAPPVDTTLAHLPPGFIPIIDEPWNQAAPPNWSLASFGQNQVSLFDDPTAPRSPGSVLQFRYEGAVGGDGAGGRTYRHSGYANYYIAFWYKHSSNWVYHDSCYNKLLYFANNQSSGTNEGIVHDDCGELSVTQQNGISRRMRSNVGGNYTMTFGQWHFVEILMTGNTAGLANGLLDWWIDGVQRGHFIDVQWKGSGDALFDAINLDPIWGGGPQTATEAQYYWLDHLIAQGKN